MAKLDRSRIPSAANSGDPAPGARPVLPPRPLSNPPLPDTQHLELQQLEMLKGLRPANANGSQQPCWLELQEWLPQIAEPFAQTPIAAISASALGSLQTACHFYSAGSAKVVLAELLKNACKFTPAEHLISLQPCTIPTTWTSKSSTPA